MYEGCNVSKQLRTLTYIHPFIHTYSYLPYITHLTAKPSRMIGVQVGVCVSRANTPTPTTYLLIALAALISVCRCMRAGAGWSMLSKVSVQGVWKVVLMLWVGKEGTVSFLP